MASNRTLQLHSVSFSPLTSAFKHTSKAELGFGCGYLDCTQKGLCRKLVMRALTDSTGSGNGKGEVLVNAVRDKVSDLKTQVARLQQRIASIANERSCDGTNLKNQVVKLQETVVSLPPVLFLMKRQPGTNFVIGWGILAIAFVFAVRVFAARKSRYSSPPGSVADLVRRGQLRSDRRGISTPLKYEDPFNNPLVKIGKGNSSIEMCGKVYRLEPITLTKEQRSAHQKRRSRAYQWKRPTVFLKEGDPVPPDVDPDTIRWIPANHPFASTVSDIDEGMAQTNVYQKHGVPSRIQAEHEAMQKKLENLQSEQNFNKLVTDPSAVKDFERPFKQNLKPDEQLGHTPSSNHLDPKPSKKEHVPNPLKSNPNSGERPKP